ncbi:MAG: hypothetical protein ACOCVF_03580 [bacterium]
MKKILHLYAKDAKKNSGDFLIGPSTKFYFKNYFYDDVEFVSMSIRNKDNFIKIDEINKIYDGIIIGSGGLILPDTRKTKDSLSGWQWNISYNN